jgi:hypothetical protein
MTYDPTPGTGGGNRTVTAFFETRTGAQEAVDALRAENIAAANIDMIEGNETAGDAPGAASAPYEEHGFWASLANLFMPSEDRYTYAEGLRRGGYLVTVHVRDEAEYDTVAAILDDRDGSIDMDQRGREWQAQGWRPTIPKSSLPDEAMSEGNVDVEPLNRITAPPADIDTTSATEDAARDLRNDANPVTREAARTGTRAIDATRPRIRSYLRDELP